MQVASAAAAAARSDDPAFTGMCSAQTARDVRSGRHRADRRDRALIAGGRRPAGRPACRAPTRAWRSRSWSERWAMRRKLAIRSRAMLRPLATLAVLAAAVALPATAQAAPAEKLYVNLGDSYATGVQDRGATKQGYADQLLKPAPQARLEPQARELRLRRGDLTSILEAKGCSGQAPAARPAAAPDRGGRAVPAPQPRRPGADHGLDRRQRRHLVRPPARPGGLRRSGSGDDREERAQGGKAPAQGGGQEGPDRRTRPTRT